jgi:hypothetical protein
MVRAKPGRKVIFVPGLKARVIQVAFNGVAESDLYPNRRVILSVFGKILIGPGQGL